MKYFGIILSAIGMLQCSCEGFNTSAQYTYRSPENTGDGLETGSLFDMDADVARIEAAVDEIQNGRYPEVHSMLIFKEGKLVLEEYFQGHRFQWDAPGHHGELVQWDMTMLHNLCSTTKSVTSACIGIAIDRGFIESAHQSIFDYLPDHRHLKTGGKEDITIEHLLTMTAGLEWREWSAPYSSMSNPVIEIWFQEKDPVSFILEMPLADTPGTTFNYSTGNMIVLGEILRNASGLDIDEFSCQYLLQPLGIDSSSWPEIYENGVINNTLYLTPRAMTRIGALFLNNGMWEGNRIIPEEWVLRSAIPYPPNLEINIPGEPSGRMGYSYSWWTRKYSESGREINLFTASGFGGQHIMILPEINSVVVFTGGNYLTRRPPFKILKKYVIPALVP